jgi:hypothetical protein
LPETIRDQWLWDAHSIVIAGTHGKTTTTGADRVVTDCGRRRIRPSSSAASRGISETTARVIGWGRQGVRHRRATSTTAPTSTRRRSS